jgi:hypothetical protein
MTWPAPHRLRDGLDSDEVVPQQRHPRLVEREGRGDRRARRGRRQEARGQRGALDARLLGLEGVGYASRGPPPDEAQEPAAPPSPEARPVLLRPEPGVRRRQPSRRDAGLRGEGSGSSRAPAGSPSGISATSTPAKVIPHEGPADARGQHGRARHAAQGVRDAPLPSDRAAPRFRLPGQPLRPPAQGPHGGAAAGEDRANREIALMSAIWNWGRDTGRTNLPNPCEGVKRNRETGGIAT